MKYLIVFLVIFLVAWRWRSDRNEPLAQKQQQRQKKAATLLPTPMVACGHCGLHLPESEAVQGSRAMYCTPAHRQAAEG